MYEDYTLDLDLEEMEEMEEIENSQDYLELEAHTLDLEETLNNMYESFYDSTQDLDNFINVMEEWG